MDLRLAQARHRFGLASGDDLATAALEPVEGGSANPTACELACLPRPTARDAGPLFERILRELAVPEISAADAQRIVAADVGRAMVSGAVCPRNGFTEMEALQEASDEPVPFWQFDMGAFYDGWAEDPDEDAALWAEFDKAVVEAARRMLSLLSEEAGGL